MKANHTKIAIDSF